MSPGYLTSDFESIMRGADSLGESVKSDYSDNTSLKSNSKSTRSLQSSKRERPRCYSVSPRLGPES